MVSDIPPGLASTQAFNVLIEDIKKTLDEMEACRPYFTKQKLLWEFSWHNFQTMLDFFGCIVIILQIILIFLAFEYADAVWYESLIAEVVFLLFLFIGNVTFKLWDSKIKHKEIIERTKFITKYLEDCSKISKWDEKNYPNLCSPLSPSIVLQPTLRDGKLVNVPWALLVRGDCVQLRPGQPIPAKCRSYQDNEEDVKNFEYNEVYSPFPDKNPAVDIRQCEPLQHIYCVLEETPYIRNLKVFVQKSCKRPTSSVEKERYLLFIMTMEHFGIPIAVAILYAVNLVRYFYFSKSIGTCSWIDLFLMQPVAATLPLTPIVFPILWRLMNAAGLAWILALFYTARKQQFTDDPFEAAAVSPHPHLTLFAKYEALKKYCMRNFRGRGPSPFRTQNLLHTFGRVTALCCLDKKGILSWPNPTAEKIFFLTTGRHDRENERKKRHKQGTEYGTQVEVLDLTHDITSPFRLQFDDQSWKNYVSNLKPLGLGILLNTCNSETQEHYSHFSSHIACESMKDKYSVPVINRRCASQCFKCHLNTDDVTRMLSVCTRWCLCEVAFQIGFSREVKASYAMESQISAFRHLAQNNREQNIQASYLPKTKFPFPHVVAVSAKENYRGDHHMFTQGTGEMVADSCVDFWDGADSIPLTHADRKKILDFYHRTSLTSYCTAFGYRPLDRPMSPKISEWYLEIPTDCEAIYRKYRTNSPLSWDGPGKLAEENQSNDSAFGNIVDIRPIESVSDVFGAQSNQTFLGMVTMQYQAKIDMVQMVEQLDKACIRFVHFSKENELRSRVFSEKMGLESGWNCHISLGEEPEEDTLQDLYCSNGSALDRSTENLTSNSGKMPRNISNLSGSSGNNIEMSQVKFEDDISVHCVGDGYTDDEGRGSKMSLCNKEDSRRCTSSSRATSSSSLLATSETNLSRSQSHITESTDQSGANVPFDMHNRAKLPKGIKNIRPHIENVDNVPLLVSLFTDCTPDVTEEMIQIMQDYGEIVCVIGSSANPQNAGAFMKGDASLAVEPLYPQLCQASPSFEIPHLQNGPSPVEVSRRLNSLPCSLSFHRDELSSLLQLILESRHLISCFQNVMQFWTCCCCSITFMHIISALVMLPPILSSGQGLWLCFVVVPLLSVSLMGLPTDPDILKVPTEKLPKNLSKELIGFILWCYCGKFLPSMLIVVLLYALCTMGFCWDIVLKSRTLAPNVTYEQCIYVYPLEKGNSVPDNWSQPELELAWFKAQHYACFFFVLYIVVISSSFVCRDKHFWQKSPLCNGLWILMSTLVLLFHGIYMSLTLYDLENEDTMYKPPFSVIPLSIWLIAFIWPLVLIAFNEAIKRNEVRSKFRLQKRARLEFGTKLGMNSPF